jgi:hypothetical protein
VGITFLFPALSMEINYFITILPLCHFFNKNKSIKTFKKKIGYHGDFNKNQLKHIPFH